VGELVGTEVGAVVPVGALVGVVGAAVGARVGSTGLGGFPSGCPPSSQQRPDESDDTAPAPLTAWTVTTTNEALATALQLKLALSDGLKPLRLALNSSPTSMQPNTLSSPAAVPTHHE
jgi:hypothetical protein